MYQRNLLTDTAVERLADATLTILNCTGIICQNEEMMRALDEWGAEVDYGREVVRFPRARVEEFVAALRKEAGPQDDGGFRTFRAPAPPQLGTLVAQFFYDDEAGERRPGSREDLIKLVKLGDVLHPEAGSGHALILREAPPLMEPLEAALVLAEYAARPGPAFAWSERQVDYLLEMGDILGIENWVTLGAICFAHPLRFDREVADRVVRMARMGLPIGLTGMQVGGASTPVTVAGFVAVSAAEFVATWIAGRALNSRVRLAATLFAGREDAAAGPLGGTMWAGTVDMKTGEVSYSAPDAMLRGFATSEFLRRWCGQPVPIGGGEYSASSVPGLYTALEKAYKAMTIAAFTGQHPPVGDGMVDQGKTISPVQLLLDAEMTAALESLARPVEATPEEIALDEILEIAHGLETNHLLTEHTLHHYRQSLWCPQLLSRRGWTGAAREADILQQARQRVELLVSQYRKPEVDPDKLACLRQVVERARRDLLG